MSSSATPHRLCDDPALPGLLWAVQFDGAGRGRVVDLAEVPEPGSFGQGYLWLHFNLVDARVAGLIDEGRLGPKHLVTSAFSADPHQRVSIEGDHVGGVVADLVHGTGDPADPAGRLHFVMGPRLLVSGRRHPIVSPDAVLAEATACEGIVVPIRLLEMLVGHVVAAMAQKGTKLADELDAIEDHILDASIREDRRRLGPIRRDAVRLHRQLLGLRSVFHRLEEGVPGTGLSSAEIATASKIAQRLDALDRDMIVLAERSRLMQDEVSADLTRQSNRQLYTLSILTALFLPPTLVTGLFGMNTKGLPLADFEDGSNYAILAAALSALSAFVLIRILGIRAPRD